jgi:ribosome biogenesis protein NSA2
MHDESTTRSKVEDVQEGAVPPYLLDRDQTQRAKVLILYVLFYSHLRSLSFDECYGIPDCFCFVALQVLSNTIKQKRKEKAGKWDVPLPKVSFVMNTNTTDS